MSWDPENLDRLEELARASGPDYQSLVSRLTSEQWRRIAAFNNAVTELERMAMLVSFAHAALRDGHDRIGDNPVGVELRTWAKGMSAQQNEVLVAGALSAALAGLLGGFLTDVFERRTPAEDILACDLEPEVAQTLVSMFSARERYVRGTHPPSENETPHASAMLAAWPVAVRLSARTALGEISQKQQPSRPPA